MEYRELLYFRFVLKENIYFFMNKYSHERYLECFKIIDGIDYDLYNKLTNDTKLLSSIIIYMITKSKSIVLEYFQISLQSFNKHYKEFSRVLLNNTLKDINVEVYYKKYTSLKYLCEENGDIQKIIFPYEKDKEQFVGNYIEIDYSNKTNEYEHIQFQNWFYGNIVYKNGTKIMHLWETDESMKKGSKAGYEIRFMDGASKDKTIEETILYDNIIEVLNVNVEPKYYKVIRGAIERIRNV